MPNVLIGPGLLRQWPDATFRAILTGAGFRLIEPPGADALTAEQFAALLPEADALIAGGEPVTADSMAASDRLRVIARVGVGYDAVDIDAATRRGVVVTITPGTNQESVAEHAFALMLAVTRRIAENDARVRQGRWDRVILSPLRGRTLGLLGLGRIGRAMVPRARAFGMDVIVHELLPTDEFDAQHGIRRVSFADLIRESDVLSLHTPLTPATRGLFAKDVFDRMKPGSVLINTARGGLVVEPDLRDALTAGPLAGAGLDVLDREPPDPANPLLTLPNVVLAPHLGGIDSRALADMADLAARCVVTLRDGGWPTDCIVNPELAPGWSWDRSAAR